VEMTNYRGIGRRRATISAGTWEVKAAMISDWTQLSACELLAVQGGYHKGTLHLRQAGPRLFAA